MDLLPEELIGEVLRRLPGRSLAMSRRVCRACRAVVDRLRLLLPHMLPHSVAGIISNYRDFSRFFACPSCTRIDAAFDFVQRGKDGLASMIVDHCNGLLLYDDGWHWTHLYVCNPATRRWALLPAVPGLDLYPGLCFAGAYLAFDPAVSLHYEVFLIPDVPEKTTGYDEEDAEDLMEWPPPCDQLMVFSSRTRRWEERAFVRVGVAAGTVAEVRSYMVVDHNWKTGYSYAEYWRGALYVHCCAGPFVSRFCTSECNYQVIKAPTNMEENENMRSNFGRSEKGMYYASFRGHRLRVWILFEESHGLPEWVLKYDVNLNLLSYRMNTLYSEEINRPWTIDDDDSEKQENNRQSAEWNSDNDDVLEYDECSHEQQRHGGFRFLGFHPYKEVVFLSHSNNDVLVPCIRNAVACHLASLKVQYLGRNNPKDFGHWQSQEGSFIYTPCLLDLLPQRE